MPDHQDVIIVGTGAGGGTLAHVLGEGGRSILPLEGGDFLPREIENWDPQAVFVDRRYVSTDTWYEADGHPSLAIGAFALAGHPRPMSGPTVHPASDQGATA